MCVTKCYTQKVQLTLNVFLLSIVCVTDTAITDEGNSATCELYARGVTESAPADDPVDSSPQFIISCTINEDLESSADDRACMGMFPADTLDKFDTVGVYINGEGMLSSNAFKATILIGTT